MGSQLSILKDRITLSNKELSKKYDGAIDSKINLPWMVSPKCNLNKEEEFMGCEEFSEGVLKRVLFSTTNERGRKMHFIRANYSTQFQLKDSASKKVASNQGICKSIGRNQVICQIKDIQFAADEPSENIERAFKDELQGVKLIP